HRAGTGVLLLPGRAVPPAPAIRLHDNVVLGNNRPNFGQPGDLVSAVPSGLGIFVVGADRVTIERNVVIGNDLVGIGLASALLFGPLTGLPPEAFDAIEPNCDGAMVRNNLVVFNGLRASNPLVRSPDVGWSGTGR